MKRASLIIGILLAYAAFASAEQKEGSNGKETSTLTNTISRIISYQGILKNSSGNPVPDNTYNLTFRIYRVSSGGSAIWTSPSTPVTTASGLFNAQIGPITLPFDTTYYLSCQIQGDVEMPRQIMAMTPYSASSDTANYAFNSAGGSQWVISGNVVYTNGYLGIARAGNALMGDSAHTMVNLGVLCTTGDNGVDNMYCTVGGGNSNAAFGNISTIGGGWYNTANGNYTTIGGGEANTSRGAYGGVASGQSNTAGDAVGDTGAFVGGGISNSARGVFSTVGGGFVNVVYGPNGTVSGGYGNNAVGDFSTVGGGSQNTASGSSSFVGGGIYNTASGSDCVVAGGNSNTAGNYSSAVGGGHANNANGAYSTVSGGYQDSASGDYSVVSGGATNSAGGYASTISGGDNNSASGQYATVGGGWIDTASGNSSTISGGKQNIASGSYGVVGGGSQNTASGPFSTVGGGVQNSASGWYSYVGAGIANVASGNYSSILGGDGNTASGSYDLAFGNGVYLVNSYRVGLFESSAPGRLGINRDDNDGDINYPIHVGINALNGNGAYLTNGGVWTNGSSRTFKENFTPFNGSELLSKISNLSVTTYNYKSSTEKHVGPVAEEFVGAFDTGVIRESDGKRDDMYLSAGDVAGVALAGVQELAREIKDLKNKNAELEKRISQLENK